MYEKSYMHRDNVTHTAVSKKDFIITASKDGHVKFWKKKPEGIEFVKHFRAHLGPITGLSVSHDGSLLCTTSVDKMLKIFDITGFDMINMLPLPFTPSVCEWIFQRANGTSIVAVANADTPEIVLYSINPNMVNGIPEPLQTLTLHSHPVKLIKTNNVFEVVVSIDGAGIIEYWSAHDYSFPSNISFKYKTDTDLYEFAKKKTMPTSLEMSQDGRLMATMGQDRHVRLFHFLTGKLYRTYNESLSIFNEAQKEEDSLYKLDAIDFGRRMAVEKAIDAAKNPPPSNVVFDESGNFILYPTMIGIKLVNVVANKIIRVIGKVENTERFLAISLYQGRAVGSIDTGDVRHDAQYDPTLICAAWKKNRFYLFTRREPQEPNEEDLLNTGRDVFNERPPKDEQTIAAKPAGHPLGSTAVIHTTLGDIHISLFAKECPKTVENFTTHSKNGYYNGLIFHRVIKGFMIQTGDPLGDGTGGTSIWGTDFEDEFHPNLRHDRPFTVSMANAGPNTNGSQFFITTVPLPRLDGKHTVFGRVTKGSDVVLAIEKVRTDKNDKPFEDVKIISINVDK